MTPADRARAVDSVFAAAIALHEEVRRAVPETLLRAADAVVSALRAGAPVLACGNGGSAADAQHFAAELVGRFERERRPWAAIALTTDTSILTAVGNDYGYDQVFARQVDAHARPGGALIGISTSGGSRNVVAAMEAARAHGLTTIALTGRDGGAIGRAADLHLNVPAASAARVQEVHITILHALCELVEGELAGL